MGEGGEEVHSREVVQGRGRGGGLRSTPEKSCRGKGSSPERTL